MAYPAQAIVGEEVIEMVAEHGLGVVGACKPVACQVKVNVPATLVAGTFRTKLATPPTIVGVLVELLTVT